MNAKPILFMMLTASPLSASSQFRSRNRPRGWANGSAMNRETPLLLIPASFPTRRSGKMAKSWKHPRTLSLCWATTTFICSCMSGYLADSEENSLDR